MQHINSAALVAQLVHLYLRSVEMLGSIARCYTMFLFAVSCKEGALANHLAKNSENNA